MWESDVFGVQDPESSEVGYCCIMGRAGEHFALSVYLGTEGLGGYQRMRCHGDSLSPFAALLLQRCLMASFEDRRHVTKRDYAVIKALGLKFRGRNSWPLFRSYLPGYVPWYLTGEEAERLTVALRQTVEVALRFKDDPGLLTPPSKNRYLVRVPAKEGPAILWRDEWADPVPVEKKAIHAEPLDVNRVRGIRRMSLQLRGTWEVDAFYLPQAVQEKEGRPYFPHAILAVDRRSNAILEFRLAKPEDFASELREAILEIMEHVEIMPRLVLVKQEEVFKLLEPIASQLKIKLRRAKRLRALEDAQEFLVAFSEDERFL